MLIVIPQPKPHTEDQPGLFLDAAQDLIERGDFNDGLRLAISSLFEFRGSIDERAWEAFCSNVRAHHPIMEPLGRSTLLSATERLARRRPELSLQDVWYDVLRHTPIVDDLVGQAIDSYLRTLPITQERVWQQGGLLRPFFECFLRLEAAKG